ncbi:MAG: STAS domain-containing protein [Chitinispirillaceae bacterium]|nr:STAS domain-containing protein [Chitinispirillaceae bacterium]
MKHFQHTVSEDMYHRVYRLMKRDTDPRLIAAALNLPLRTVLNVLARLKKHDLEGAAEATGCKSEKKKRAGQTSFLDVYFLAKTRYAILQLVGHCTREQGSILEAELHKAQTSAWKAIAIRMSDVTALDEWAAHQLLDFCLALKARERFVALLDPPAPIEPAIMQYGLEQKVQVFGTVHAFEEEAFVRKAPTSHQRSRRNR